MAKYLDFHSKEERDFDDTALLELFRRAMREDRKVRRKVRLIPVPERLADIERCVRFLERLAMNIGLDPRECIRVEQRELQPTGVDITFAVPWFRAASVQVRDRVQRSFRSVSRQAITGRPVLTAPKQWSQCQWVRAMAAMGGMGSPAESSSPTWAGLLPPSMRRDRSSPAAMPRTGRSPAATGSEYQTRSVS